MNDETFTAISAGTVPEQPFSPDMCERGFPAPLAPDFRARIISHASCARVHSAHEHIGSLISFGRVPGPWFPSDVQPALRPGKTTLLELLFAPYTAPQLFAMGAAYPPPEAFCQEDAFISAMNALRPHLFAATTMISGPSSSCRPIHEAFQSVMFQGT